MADTLLIPVLKEFYENEENVDIIKKDKDGSKQIIFIADGIGEYFKNYGSAASFFGQEQEQEEEDGQSTVVRILVDLGLDYLNTLGKDEYRKQHIIGIMDKYNIPKNGRNELFKGVRQNLKLGYYRKR